MAVSGARKHQGKELSYNNLLDLDSAWRLICEFDRTAAAVIKHTNPCGAALGSSPLEAYLRAREGDPVSAFGGIVSFNRPVDAAVAKELAGTFLEAVIAPAFESDALEVLSAKKNLRVLSVDDPPQPNWGSFNMCRIVGGLLVQEWDLGSEDSKLEVVTERKPSDEEMEALQFSWKVVKHIKSNAILVARKDRTLGVGAGQMSRVDSCELAIKKSNESLEGTVAASDAFFPFRDGVDVLADAGVTAIIQPGGSIRDEEVVTAANERGVAMVFTGTRHFKH
jgi:phosphoribosylaminoimidazolecarboxamide formyltransferase/IMP cyclohydrolase